MKQYTIEYSLDELYPVFEKLSTKYMGLDTSSLPYEKAQELMSAVIYCIRHQGELYFASSNKNELQQAGEKLSAADAYAKGLEVVRQKTRHAAGIYAEIMDGFDNFGSHAYDDTLTKGMPEFFKWYDPEFEPENHMLTFDYPILRSMEGLTGIDAIYTYLECICCEQRLLRGFSGDDVVELLHLENSGYVDFFENICRSVVRRAVLCMLAGCNVRRLKLKSGEFDALCHRLHCYDAQALQDLFEKALTAIVNKFYPNDRSILSYVLPDMHDFAFEFISARSNNYLDKFIRCN